MKKELVKEIIKRYDGDDGMLIPMMQDLQAEYGYLPAEQLKMLSHELSIPVTFYSSFRNAPKGQHDVTLCMGTVCYLKGADKISETICKEFTVDPGGTTPDRLFSYQPVNCVGACALAPVMIVDGEYYDGVTPDKAMEILNSLESTEVEQKESTAVKKVSSSKKKSTQSKKTGTEEAES
jgi:NADH:ubiquinone oxidoreductase subunit E